MNNNVLLFFQIRFVLQPVSHIRKELSEKLQSNEEKIKSIEVAICNCGCAHSHLFQTYFHNPFSFLKLMGKESGKKRSAQDAVPLQVLGIILIGY